MLEDNTVTYVLFSFPSKNMACNCLKCWAVMDGRWACQLSQSVSHINSHPQSVHPFSECWSVCKMRVKNCCCSRRGSPSLAKTHLPSAGREAENWSRSSGLVCGRSGWILLRQHSVYLPLFSGPSPASDFNKRPVQVGKHYLQRAR